MHRKIFSDLDRCIDEVDAFEIELDRENKEMEISL